MDSTPSRVAQGLEFAAAFIVIATSWWTIRRRQLARAKWVVYASGDLKYERALLVVVHGSAPPEPEIIAIAGCNTVEEIVGWARRRPDLIDHLLLWRAPATEQPAPFALAAEESAGACADRLRAALEVTPEEVSRPPAVRPHQERAANRDWRAWAPVLVMIGAVLPIVLLAAIDPFRVDPPPQVAVASVVASVCSEAQVLCESASRVNRFLEANECEAAATEMTRLAAAFTRLPEPERTDSLERALNVLQERAQGCAPSAR